MSSSLPFPTKPMRVPLFIRVKSGSPVMACCPTIPGLCVIGASVTEVTREIRRRIRDAILADPSIVDDASVTFCMLDVASDQFESSTLLPGPASTPGHR